MKDTLAIAAWFCCLALTRATLTITDISGDSENLDRPCPGDTVVYTCTLSGVALVWNIPGVFPGSLAYVAGASGVFVGAIQTDPTSGSEANLTAIGAPPASLTSTLTITASNDRVRNGSTIQCGSAQSFMMDLNIASPPSAPVCSSFTPSSASEGVIDVTFSLSIPFDGRESIDNYHVTPPTVPCGSPMSSRNQVQYQCSGLMVGQVYGFTVRAVNCENQQGPESGTITVTPQVPDPPALRVQQFYGQSTGELLSVTSTWDVVDPVTIVSGCNSIQDQGLSYSISYQNGSGFPATFNVNCSNGVCQNLFQPQVAGNYIVTAAVRNVVGQSISSTTNISGTNDMFNCTVDARFPDDNVTVMCKRLTLSGSANCTISYGQDVSNLLSTNSCGTLETGSNMIQYNLTLDSNTNYYFAVQMDSSSRSVAVKGSFLTGIQCPEAELIPIQNGMVEFALRTPGTDANYTCNDGYTLIGARSRVCLTNGMWNGIIPTCIKLCTVVPTTLNSGAAVGIAVVVAGIISLVIGVLIGVLLYHCINKHQQWSSKPEASSHQQQQTGPEYEEVSATSGGEKVELRRNVAYEPVQKIEMRENVAYGPVQH